MAVLFPGSQDFDIPVKLQIFVTTPQARSRHRPLRTACSCITSTRAHLDIVSVLAGSLCFKEAVNERAKYAVSRHLHINFGT